MILNCMSGTRLSCEAAVSGFRHGRAPPSEDIKGSVHDSYAKTRAAVP